MSGDVDEAPCATRRLVASEPRASSDDRSRRNAFLVLAPPFVREPEMTDERLAEEHVDVSLGGGGRHALLRLWRTSWTHRLRKGREIADGAGRIGHRVGDALETSPFQPEDEEGQM
jgi:hypothetical protein